MKKKSTPKKKVVKKGWVLAIGLSSRDRKKIKFYLTKKRAIDGEVSRAKVVRPATLTYTLP